MEKKQKVDAINSSIMMLIGMIIIGISAFYNLKLELLLPITFGVYTISNITRFIINKKSKDYDGIHTGLASLISLIVSIVIGITTPKNLFIVLMIWTILIALTKLKKADYYHDRKDRMWKLRLFTLVTFILISVLTSINLANENVTIIIGFYFTINGLLEMFDPIAKTLIKHG